MYHNVIYHDTDHIVQPLCKDILQYMLWMIFFFFIPCLQMILAMKSWKKKLIQHNQLFPNYIQFSTEDILKM